MAIREKIVFYVSLLVFLFLIYQSFVMKLPDFAKLMWISSVVIVFSLFSSVFSRFIPIVYV